MLGPAEQKFLDMLSAVTRSLGLGEAAGRIWGVLALAGRPMTQAEIASLTGYSLPIVSTSIATLESWGFVRREGRKGRSRLYKASSTLLDLLESFLSVLLEKRLTPLANYLRENLDHFKPDYRERTAQLLIEYEKAKSILKMLISDLKRLKNEDQQLILQG